MINKLIEFDLAETCADETTQEIQLYDGQGYRLFDIPNRNDDISYFSMEYIAFWKELARRPVLITATIKEMRKIFRLLVPVEEKQAFKQKLDEHIHESNLQGVDHIWYVSALNPNEFLHWLVMVDSLANYPKNVVDE